MRTLLDRIAAGGIDLVHEAAAFAVMLALGLALFVIIGAVLA